MIDNMSPERYIAAGAAKRIAEDKAGVQWRSQWHDWCDAWATVEVVNGTPEPDGPPRDQSQQDCIRYRTSSL